MYTSLKVFISEVNRKERLHFAKRQDDKGADFWNRVIFSDKSKFIILSTL